MSKRRAIGITTSEISVLIWIFGFVVSIIGLKIIIDLLAPVEGLQGTLSVFVMLSMLGLIMSFVSMAYPNFQISKHNLNLFIDRITNPDFIGWIRFNRNKKVSFQIVKSGPLGQTKGMASDHKADVMNTSDYTVTTTNGNQAILVSDLLSSNINLDNALGWNLINKHFGFVGFRAWERAVKDNELVFNKIEEKK